MEIDTHSIYSWTYRLLPDTELLWVANTCIQASNCVPTHQTQIQHSRVCNTWRNTRTRERNAAAISTTNTCVNKCTIHYHEHNKYFLMYLKQASVENSVLSDQTDTSNETGILIPGKSNGKYLTSDEPVHTYMYLETNTGNSSTQPPPLCNVTLSHEKYVCSNLELEYMSQEIWGRYLHITT